MPTLRIERVPISVYYLGLIGFDHLQLVYEQDRSPANQASWFVLEGLRDAAVEGPFLGVEGTDGRTTLSQANGGARDLDLVRKIGTPETRGSVIIPTPGGATSVWETMASFGGAIDEQMLPYIGYGFAGSIRPTINSSSVVASLLFYGGIDIANYLPIGLGISPGTTTLIGTASDDELQIVNSFNALVGGDGNDTLEGGVNSGLTERFLGGKGDDIIKWSDGVNLINGGQPRLAYENDGWDNVDYSGVGHVVISLNSNWVPGVTANFFATHDGGREELYSIEGIYFNDKSDIIELGEGVHLILDDLTLNLNTQDGAGRGDSVSFKNADSGLTINAAGSDNYFVQVSDNPSGSTAGIWLESAEWLEGSGLNDKIYGGENVRGLDGGAGDDILDARETKAFTKMQNGYDVELYGGIGDDTIVSGSGISIATGGDGADRFILSTLTAASSTVEFVIADATSSDRLFVPHEFFTQSQNGFDKSLLMPLLGGFAQFPGQTTFADLPENLGPWAGGPNSRSDFAIFTWQTQDQVWNGNDQTQGVFEFNGNILYNREGSDLLIHVFNGFTIEVTETGYADLDWTHTLNAFNLNSETIIRVQDFDDGDLGINFYDPGEPVGIDLPVLGARPRGANDYPNWDAGVDAMTNGGTLDAALDLRPQAPVYDPDKNKQGDAPETIARGDGDDVISVSAGTAEVTAGGGDDSIRTASGNDSIDGGTGADSMQGGAGNDSYIVDNAGDTVFEGAGEGYDSVTAKINYALTANVERLTLTDAAVTGMGNGLNNRLYGNDLGNSLYGRGGDDTLYGGAGDDLLDGASGNDTYIYQAGDGNDVIIDAGNAADVDVLILDEVLPEDVHFHILDTEPGSLVLTFRGGGRILLQSFLTGGGQGIERVEFGDGTVWTRTQLQHFAETAPLLHNDAPQAVDDVGFGVRAGTTFIPGSVFTQNDVDFDGDTLTISSLGAITPGLAVTLDKAGNVTISTPGGYEGLANFSYTVSDGLSTSTANVELTVLKNNVPIVSGTLTDQPAKTGTAFSYILPEGLFTDADDDVLLLSAHLNGAQTLPAWLRFNAATGTLSGTPPNGSAGNLAIVIAATDGAASASLTFNLVIEGSLSANTITGTGHNDVLTGTAANETIAGLGGDDIMRGRGGDDTFTIAGTGDGYDVFIGGAGLDSITGSGQNDVIGVSGRALALSGIESINGGEGTDTLRFGHNGKAGPGSSDNKINLTGIELISVELVAAGAGDDVILGSHGDDRLRGGAGDDRFVFRGTFGHDAITDFHTGHAARGHHDVIDLRGSGYASFSALKAHASELGGDTLIDMGAEGSVLLEGVRISQLRAYDFIL